MSWQHTVQIAVTAPSGRVYDRVFIRNEADDQDRLTALRASLSAAGWSGEPVIMQEHDGTLYAFTGSHRLTVASELEIEVDVVWMPDLTPKHHDAIHGAYDDDDLLSAIEDAGWKRDGFDEVVDVIQAEVAANGRWLRTDDVEEPTFSPASAWP